MFSVRVSNAGNYTNYYIKHTGIEGGGIKNAADGGPPIMEHTGGPPPTQTGPNINISPS